MNQAQLHVRYADRDGFAGGHPKFFVAGISLEIGGQRIASLALFDNPHVRYNDAPTMQFGDVRVPAGNEALLEPLLRCAAETSAMAKKTFLIGPMNGSTWVDYRIPLTGEWPLFAGDNPLPSALGKYLIRAGFSVADNYRSSIADITRSIESSAHPGLRIRPITVATLDDDLKSLHPLCMEAFAGAPYFSPIIEAEFLEQFETVRPLVSYALSFVAEQEGNTIGFVLAYPDLLDPKRATIVIKTLARHPDYPISGSSSLLIDTVCEEARRQGYSRAIHAFMHEDNRSVRRSEDYGGTVLRRYALFVKKVAADG